MHVADMGKTDNLAIRSTSHSHNVLGTYIWGSVWYKSRERELSEMEVERYLSWKRSFRQPAVQVETLNLFAMIGS